MNDLTTIDNSELQEIEALLGTQAKSGGSGSSQFRVPELKINSRTRDKDTKRKSLKVHIF